MLFEQDPMGFWRAACLETTGAAGALHFIGHINDLVDTRALRSTLPIRNNF